MQDKNIINGYYNLAAAIVLQAMEDYKRALRAIRDGNKDYRYRKTKRECETFFLSSWGQLLSLNNGARLIEKCKKEVEEGEE